MEGIKTQRISLCLFPIYILERWASVFLCWLGEGQVALGLEPGVQIETSSKACEPMIRHDDESIIPSTSFEGLASKRIHLDIFILHHGPITACLFWIVPWMLWVTVP